MSNETQQETGPYKVPVEVSCVETHEHRLVKYADGTIREDFKASGNTFLGSARPRGADEAVGVPYEPDKPKEARTSHPRGWVRYSDFS